MFPLYNLRQRNNYC